MYRYRLRPFSSRVGSLLVFNYKTYRITVSCILNLATTLGLQHLISLTKYHVLIYQTHPVMCSFISLLTTVARSWLAWVFW